MSFNPAPEEVTSGLRDFVRFRRDHLKGDEKGEAQVFLDRLFLGLGFKGVFEAGATLEQRVAKRDAGGTAFADLVWKPRVLIEMKKAGEDLAKHYRQAFDYWIDLVPDRPSYVVLCNFDEFWIYDLNRQLDEPVDRVSLDALPDRWETFSFLLPDPAEPVFGNDLIAVTRDSAARVSQVFNALIQRGVSRGVAQRFILQALMAMFAEDIRLLPTHLMSQAVSDSLKGGSTYDLIFGLFREMNTPGETPSGRFAGTPYFNGGLFRNVEPIDLVGDELELLAKACDEDWSEVRPAIFGTLFEQSLEMDERHAYGAHFTSETDIQRVVLPTIVRPWRQRIDEANTLEELGRVEADLVAYRVLDPTCGCGNFLYVAYRELRRLERDLALKVRDRRRAAGASAELRMAFVSTTQFYGIDINPFAVEIAKVTLMLARKLAADELDDERAVLPLDDLDDNFAAGDALTLDWPAFHACIGNPPYLGRQKLTAERGSAYAATLDRAFPQVRGFADYVSYFFQRTHDRLPEGGRAGLVGTNTVRQGATREATLDYILDHGGVIYDAVSSQPWSGDAQVHVSIVNWVKGPFDGLKTLWLSDGTTKVELETLTGSLSPSVDLRKAAHLRANRRPKRDFQGQTPGRAAFVLSPEEAALMIERSGISAEVIHPYMIGEELAGEGKPLRYIIDIPAEDGVAAQKWPAPLEHVRSEVLPVRREKAAEEQANNEAKLAVNPNAKPNRHHQNFLTRWWQLSYRRRDLLDAIDGLDRYIAVSRVAVESRPSIYVFLDPAIRPGDALQVFAFDDDYSFGILTSALHRLWFEQRCSTMKVDLRYTSDRVFDSFPWPQAPSPEDAVGVASAAAALLGFREAQVDAGISLGHQYGSLKDEGKNELRDLHAAIDDAVYTAYGFSSDDDDLAQLLALNQSISLEEESDSSDPRRPGNLGLPGTRLTHGRISSV